MILGKKPTLSLMLAPLLERDYLGPPRPWHCISLGNFRHSLSLFFVAGEVEGPRHMVWEPPRCEGAEANQGGRGQQPLSSQPQSPPVKWGM